MRLVAVLIATSSPMSLRRWIAAAWSVPCRLGTSTWGSRATNTWSTAALRMFENATGDVRVTVPGVTSVRKSSTTVMLTSPACARS